MRNTLQAYTAPRATCITTPAAAINHRLGVLARGLLITISSYGRWTSEERILRIGFERHDGVVIRLHGLGVDRAAGQEAVRFGPVHFKIARSNDGDFQPATERSRVGAQSHPSPG